MCVLGPIFRAGQVQDEAQRVTGVILQAYGRVHSQHLHANRRPSQTYWTSPDVAQHWLYSIQLCTHSLQCNLQALRIRSSLECQKLA